MLLPKARVRSAHQRRHERGNSKKCEAKLALRSQPDRFSRKLNLGHLRRMLFICNRTPANNRHSLGRQFYDELDFESRARLAIGPIT